ncbi:MAG: thioesterase [Elusimicrobia bacterium]|nr:thioesterase [Elusimicrobiota bacterium]MDE2236445.1 thioesterase [Elusimicrobiota bacterium]MDE2426721.1 thioesterase [Elusimicrobiota bacterium]
MKPGFKVGITVDLPATVKPSMKPHLEGLVGHRLYSTWAMVYHMETASRMLLAPYLSPEEEAVGGGLLVKHLRPARVGAPLHIAATLARVRGNRIYTRIRVYSRGRRIGEGSMVQVVMTRSRFAKLMQEARGR